MNSQNIYDFIIEIRAMSIELIERMVNKRKKIASKYELRSGNYNL